MEKQDIIELENKEYLVYEKIELNNNEYFILCPISNEEINENESIVVKLQDNLICSIDDSKEKEIVEQKLKEMKEEN